MMGQRKLTGFEADKIAILLNDLDKAAELIGCNDARQYFPDAVDMLANMRIHRTTDGNPYVEPQPEIGEGYRLATEADVRREDVEFWSLTKGGRWMQRATGCQLFSHYTYRVPKDRIPTDEDAVGRPMVMVRDRIDGEAWQPGKLIEVDPCECQEFYARVDSYQESFWWDECRFPYPGELP